MAKAGTEQNVEDMLSSVRRLVSDELPRMPRAEPPKGPTALVLTEAQRIEPPLMGHNSRRKSLEDRIAELEAAVANSSDDYEPDGSEDLEQHRPNSIVFRPTRPVTKPPLQLTDVVSEETVIARAEVSEEAPDEDESPEIVQEGVELAVTEAVTETVADMAEDALGQDETFERALAEAVGVEEITPDEDSSPSTEHAPDVPDDLRPLISAIIREELQGELGERITRNVRKLVRQEIQRALTVREIE